MNNYNMSTSGINLEVNLFRDGYIAQMNFDENFKRIKNDTFLYLAFGNLSDEFIITIIDRDIQKLKNIIIDKEIYYPDNNLDEYDIGEIHQLFYDNFDTLELYHFCLNNDIDIKETYKTVYITGYSQGDSAYIIVNTDEFFDVTGVKFDYKEHNNYFTNYYYDQPLYCQITCNSNDYQMEFVDEYKYYDDEIKQEIITWSLKNINVENKELLKAELLKLLPNSID